MKEKLAVFMTRDDAETLLVAIRFVSEIYAQDTDDGGDGGAYANEALDRIAKRLRKALEAR